jgi:Holliday junction resolvase RusA-like endonuclease
MAYANRVEDIINGKIDKSRIKDQFARPTTIEPQELYLPFPPSTNGLFRDASDRERARGDRKRKCSPGYEAWKDTAGFDLNRQNPKRMAGKVEVWIYLQDDDNRRSDCDNRSKAVLDLLVGHGIIEADDKRIVRSCHQVWSPGTRGCRVSIRPAPVHGGTE